MVKGTIHKAGLSQLVISDRTDTLAWPYDLGHDPAVLHHDILRGALY